MNIIQKKIFYYHLIIEMFDNTIQSGLRKEDHALQEIKLHIQIRICKFLISVSIQIKAVHIFNITLKSFLIEVKLEMFQKL